MEPPVAGTVSLPTTYHAGTTNRRIRGSVSHRKNHLAALREVAAAPPPYPGGKGRGVVTVGGGKYWPGIVVQVRMLRELGSKLPVQVWYRGSCEAVDPAAVAGMDVELIDADAVSARDGDNRVPTGKCQGEMGGWELKSYAITKCPFKQVLFFDADAYPVEDPLVLFRFLAHHPFVAWEDNALGPGHVRWDVVWPDGANGAMKVQGGQFLTDRETAWPALAVAHWINQHSDFYYGFMYGDQDAWRVGCAATGVRTHSLGPAGWQDDSFVCRYPRVPYVVHRCRAKLFRPTDIPKNRPGYSTYRAGLPKEDRVFAHLAAALAGDRDVPDTFRACYERKLWGGGSGTGSRADTIGPYAETVNALARLAGWRSATDAGCGDGLTATRLAFGTYTGVDAYAPAVARLAAEHPHRSWVCADFYRDRDRLPPADVLLVKDVINHWPNDWVADFLSWVRASGRWKAALFTQDVRQVADGQDVHLGGHRPLDPGMAPLAPFRLETISRYGEKAILLLDPNRCST